MENPALIPYEEPIDPVIDTSQVPDIVNNIVNRLIENKKKVDEANKKAEHAKTTAQNAKEKPVGFRQKKEAIQSLQDAGTDLADAIVSTTQAQKESFLYNQALAEAVKYLFFLGASDISMNRSVVRQLELKLQGASKEELDELAKEELLNVVRQLKAQEDIIKKQSDLSSQVKEHDQLIAEVIFKDQEQDKELARQAQIDDVHDRLFREKAKRDNAQDAELSRQARKDTEHDKLLSVAEKKDKEQDEELARQTAKDVEHDALIALINQKNSEQDKELARQAQLATERSKLLAKLKEQGQEQDIQLNELEKQKNAQSHLIESILKTNESQASEIDNLKSLCINLQQQIERTRGIQSENTTDLISRIENKTSKVIGIISLAVGASALIMSIIHFLL